MTTKLVLRLLDAAGQLLGWTQLSGVAKGDGCLRVESVVLTPSVSGTGTEVVIHWPDVHIQKRLQTEVQARAGVPLLLGTLTWVLPTDAGPLPAVTVGEAVSVCVPTGAVGARGN